MAKKSSRSSRPGKPVSVKAEDILGKPLTRSQRSDLHPRRSCKRRVGSWVNNHYVQKLKTLRPEQHIAFHAETQRQADFHRGTNNEILGGRLTRGVRRIAARRESVRNAKTAFNSESYRQLSVSWKNRHIADEEGNKAKGTNFGHSL